jgi:MFS family permease
LLLGGRGLRSLAQAYLVIIVPLYLAGLGFSAEQLGIVFTAAAVSSALLTAGVGILSDRFGRKTFLILISLLMAAGGLVFALSGDFVVLVIAGALGTIGRGGGAGSGGAWGPFFPAEQALLAEHAGDARRTSIFGLVSFVGVMAGAVGSLLAALPALLHQEESLSVIDGDRVLFLLTTALGILMALLFLPLRERVPEKPGRTSDPAGTYGSPATQASVAQSVPRGRRLLGLSGISWRLVARFMITNSTNGLAIGIIGPFIVYWFFRRYGVGSDVLAGLFFVINLVAALPYLLAGRLARRLGAVNLVVLTRSISVVLLAVMAVMPTFAPAAAFYLLRTAFNTLSNPVRQSYLMGVIPLARAFQRGGAGQPAKPGGDVDQPVYRGLPHPAGRARSTAGAGRAAAGHQLGTVLYLLPQRSPARGARTPPYSRHDRGAFECVLIPEAPFAVCAKDTGFRPFQRGEPLAASARGSRSIASGSTAATSEMRRCSSMNSSGVRQIRSMPPLPPTPYQMLWIPWGRFSKWTPSNCGETTMKSKSLSGCSTPRAREPNSSTRCAPSSLWSACANRRSKG